MAIRRRARPAARRIASALVRLVSIADHPADDEDLRRRKRVGVVAGFVTIFVPLLLPVQGRQLAGSLPLAVGLSLFAIANLIVLARSRNFARYVLLLTLSGVVFVPAATFVGGGITGSAAGLVWAFLIPAYTLLALGPRQATRWYLVYLGVVAFMVVIDPLARAAVPAPSYVLQVLGQIQNSVIPLSVVYLLLRYTDTRRLAAEARADELLTNAIPATIAARLRRGERRIAESYPATSILFADIVGFTPWALRTAPDEVVALLDAMFTRFDELADRRGLEKIKTIGDAYMAAAGAPEPRADHAVAAIHLGEEMIDVVAALRSDTGIPLEIRVGIATGPVVGGVIGRRRLLFDLWGDTVNLASRMESSGVPGRIQVAGSTHDAARGEGVEFEAREVEVKGLGRLTAYLVR